jgi:hypothetical protein
MIGSHLRIYGISPCNYLLVERVKMNSLFAGGSQAIKLHAGIALLASRDAPGNA